MLVNVDLFIIMMLFIGCLNIAFRLIHGIGLRPEYFVRFLYFNRLGNVLNVILNVIFVNGGGIKGDKNYIYFNFEFDFLI